MNDKQGQVMTPTGCHLAEQTPLDQCFESIEGQVAGSAPRPENGQLPRVGSDLQIIIPIALAILATLLYLIVKKYKNIA
jgi:hypothetical protein